MPCAETYHLTWTCYGQWLHGDAHGSVDREHRTPGTPYAPADGRSCNAEANRMTEPACWLTDRQRVVVESALREACEFRGWRLMAVNAQPDHVHVVVEAPETDGKRVRQVLKDRSARALGGADAGRRHWWTEGGKVDRIRSTTHLRQAVEYVEGKQHFAAVEGRTQPAAPAAGSEQRAAGSEQRAAGDLFRGRCGSSGGLRGRGKA